MWEESGTTLKHGQSFDTLPSVISHFAATELFILFSITTENTRFEYPSGYMLL
jgi:hypothetical protein